MALVTLLDSHLAFGDSPLLDGARFVVDANERIGLIGRNGTGKSTLLRIIAGRVQLDDGVLQRREAWLSVSWSRSPSSFPRQRLEKA